MNLNKIFYKYIVYYPVLLLRGEWIGVHLRELNKTQYYSGDNLRKLQLHRLNELLDHARKTVPYYHELPNKHLDNLVELSEIPFLEKEDLRSSNDQLRSSKKGFMVRYKTTGGSTGAAVTVRKDANGMAKELAATWRGCMWAGVDIGDKQARFWGVPHTKKGQQKAKLIDRIANRERVSAFSFSESDLKIYCERLQKFKPDYFYGYASMIREMADYVSDNPQYGNILPKAIFTTAEVLADSDRVKIQNAFHCKIYNEYGCGEIGTIAHECEYGSMHLTSENMIVEILDDNGIPVKPGQSGEIVVTDLVNMSMPLIRYRIKDYGSIRASDCDCKRTLPILEGIYGREYDMLVNTRGEKFHGEFFLYMVEDLNKKNVKVSGFQIIQIETGLKVNVQCHADVFSTAMDYLKTNLRKKFDPKISIDVTRVAKIEREASGKLRVVKRLG